MHYVAEKANSLPSCIKKSIASKSRQVMLPSPLSPDETHLCQDTGCCVHCWAFHYKRDRDIMKGVQQRARTVIKGLKDVLHEARLRELEVFRLE